MKSLFHSLTICFFFIPIIQAQEIEEGGYIEISADRIKNTKIKSLKEESDCYVEQEKPPYKFEDCGEKLEEKYDANGNITLLKIYEDGDLTNTYTYTYQNNRLIQEEEDDTEDIYKKSYKYNTNGLLIEKNEYENKKLEYRYTYAYNAKGLMTEKIYQSLRRNESGFGSATYVKTIYTYNQNGKIASGTEYLKDGRKKDKTIYEYSNKERTVAEKKERDDDEYVPEYISTYDTKGNLIERIFYDYYGKKERRVVEAYDTTNNRILYENYNENDQLSERTTYIYNAQNDISQYTTLYPKEATGRDEDRSYTTKYVYEYDTQGNWTTKITFSDGDDYGSDEIKRTLKYY